MLGCPMVVLGVDDTDGLEARVTVSTDASMALIATDVMVMRPGNAAVTSRDLRRVPVMWMTRAVLTGHPDLVVGQRRTDADPAMTQVVETWRRMRDDPGTAHRPIEATADALCWSRGYVSRLLTQARRERLIP